MYFDPRPKTKKEDLYDRVKQLETFNKALTHSPLIVVTGLRRTGKTSFLNVAMAESNQPYTLLDMRGLPYNPSYADIVRRLETAFNRIDRQWFTGLSDALKHLKGVSIMGNEVTFGWGKTGIDLPELFGKINDWAARENKQFIIAFDEIQVVRGDKWIPQFFAHVADTYRNITLVLTGSECGLLFDFLGFENPKAPLYGRDYVQIHMESFLEPEVKDFLTIGFQQANIEVSAEVLNYAIQNLDGIAGWLTLFGSRCLTRQSSSKALVDEVVLEAGRLAREEALKLTLMSRRYGIALNFLGEIGAASWGQIKSTLEAKEGHSLTSSAASKLLNALVKSGFAVKTDDKYALSDPLMLRGIREEPLPE